MLGSPADEGYLYFNESALEIDFCRDECETLFFDFGDESEDIFFMEEEPPLSGGIIINSETSRFVWINMGSQESWTTARERNMRAS